MRPVGRPALNVWQARTVPCHGVPRRSSRPTGTAGISFRLLSQALDSSERRSRHTDIKPTMALTLTVFATKVVDAALVGFGTKDGDEVQECACMLNECDNGRVQPSTSNTALSTCVGVSAHVDTCMPVCLSECVPGHVCVCVRVCLR